MKTIYRHAYLPAFNPDTHEYYWKKLHVVKVWPNLNSLPYCIGRPFTIEYILENALRVNENKLITEDNKDTKNIKLEFDNLVMRYMKWSGFIPKTIFQPYTKMCLRGKELEDLIEQSKKEIQELIQYDEILGEQSVNQLLKEYADIPFEKQIMEIFVFQDDKEVTNQVLLDLVTETGETYIETKNNKVADVFTIEGDLF